MNWIKENKNNIIFYSIAGVVVVIVIVVLAVIRRESSDFTPPPTVVQPQATRGAGANILEASEPDILPIQTIFLDGYRSGFIQACWALTTEFYEKDVAPWFIKAQTEAQPDVTAIQLVELWKGYWLTECVQAAQQSIVNGIGNDLYNAWLEDIE